MTAVARPRKRTAAVINTISKADALKEIRSGEMNPNRYKRPCILCGEIVPEGEGVLGGNKTEGWWAGHANGSCMPTTTAKVRRSPVKKMEEAAQEDTTAGKVDKPNVKVRGTNNTPRSTEVPAKKTAARRPVAKRGAVKPNAPTGAKKTATPRATTKKTATTKPESASEETSDEMMEAVKGITEMITSGVLDEFLGMIDDAISDRIDATTPAPAKKTAAKKTTTPATTAQKVAPVTRKRAESASPAKTEPLKLRKGFPYVISDKRLSSNGQKVKFMTYVPDTDNKKASVTLLNEFKGKPAGYRFTVPVRALDKSED